MNLVDRLLVIVVKYNGLLLEGLKNTLILTIVSFIIGFLIGLPASLARVYGSKPLKWLSTVYVELIRGTPMMVQLFFVYFALPQFGITLDPLTAAFLGMGLNSGAYQAEYFRSAIMAIPRGQWEAALSIGMTKFQAFMYIIAPQALRISIPAWTNELAIVLKDTSIAYAIGVSEIFTQAIHVAQATLDYFTPLVIIAVIYFTITSTVNHILNRLHRKYMVPGLGGGVER